MPAYRLTAIDNTDVTLVVHQSHTWHRGDIDHMDMSISGGPKDQIRNQVFMAFEKDPLVDSVTLVVGNRTPLMVVRKGQQYFVAGREVRVTAVTDKKIPPGGKRSTP